MTSKLSASGLGVLAVAVLLPWTAGMSVLGRPYPTDVLESPRVLLTLAALLLCAWAVRRDVFLALFVAWAGVETLGTRAHYGGDFIALTIALSALAITLIRSLDADWRKLGQAALVLGGAAQSLYCGLQYIGWDFLGVEPGRMFSGTLGHSNFVGAYLALTAPLAPPWALLFFIPGFVLSHSLLSILATLIGLGLRYRAEIRRYPLHALFALSVAMLAFNQRGPSMDSAYSRLAVATYAIIDWFSQSPLFGVGLAGWWGRFIGVQIGQYHIWWGEIFNAGHNDWLQAGYELGLVGLALIAAMIYGHRRAFLSPAGGALAALGIECLGMFPMRLPTLAITAIAVIGLATAESRA